MIKFLFFGRYIGFWTACGCTRRSRVGKRPGGVGLFPWQRPILLVKSAKFHLQHMRIRDPGPNNRLLGDDGPYRGIAGEKAQQPSTPCGLRRRTSRSRWPDPATNLAWLPDHYDCVYTKHTSVRFLILVVVQLLNGGRLIIEAPAFPWSKLELNHAQPPEVPYSRVESSSEIRQGDVLGAWTKEL